MADRICGEKRDCYGCRYWSEMIAGCDGGGLIKAFCLNSASPKHTKWTPGRDSCEAWASGHLGAIDEPGADPSRYEDEAAERMGERA